MLIGEYHHNIDDKGRLTIPSKFREEIGEKFIVTRGLDNCLFVYSLVEWEKIVSKLKTLPLRKKMLVHLRGSSYQVLLYANLINKVELT